MDETYHDRCIAAGRLQGGFHPRPSTEEASVFHGKLKRDTGNIPHIHQITVNRDVRYAARRVVQRHSICLDGRVGGTFHRIAELHFDLTAARAPLLCLSAVQSNMGASIPFLLV